MVLERTYSSIGVVYDTVTRKQGVTHRKEGRGREGVGNASGSFAQFRFLTQIVAIIPPSRSSAAFTP